LHPLPVPGGGSFFDSVSPARANKTTIMTSDQTTTNRLRDQARTIFQAGIDAADPARAVAAVLSCRDGQPVFSPHPLSPNAQEKPREGQWKRVFILSFGKAAIAMAQAAAEIIPNNLLQTPGIIVTNYENADVSIPGFEVIAAGHPLPDVNGVAGATKIAEIARAATKDDLVLVLVSGGGSALLPLAADGLNLEDKVATTDLMLACGASINDMNCVRKHLSKLKGGGLANMAAPADLHALILSDVIGDDLSTIASGPTVPDVTTFKDAVDILKRYDIWEKVPAIVRTRLKAGMAGDIPDTPDESDPLFRSVSHHLIGSNTVSVHALLNAADKNFEGKISDYPLCGEAREAADTLALKALECVAQSSNKPFALVTGGETTVTLKGNGLGGRNQEMALAFALAAEKIGLIGNWVFLSGGTDGRDGPNDAAGGLVDPGTLTRMRAQECDPSDFLDNNDSYHALEKAQDLLMTGPTGTNVADLQIFLYA
jgi:glycerate 2-kinase